LRFGTLLAAFRTPWGSIRPTSEIDRRSMLMVRAAGAAAALTADAARAQETVPQLATGQTAFETGAARGVGRAITIARALLANPAEGRRRPGAPHFGAGRLVARLGITLPDGMGSQGLNEALVAVHSVRQPTARQAAFGRIRMTAVPQCGRFGRRNDRPDRALFGRRRLFP
jgi:hypothetical protein